VDWNAELIWKMRMELAFQWELVEDEIPDVFRNLLGVIKAPLLFLESLIQGQSMKSLGKMDYSTDFSQSTRYRTPYLKESISGFKISSISPV
jgi:hypothetical protein